MSDAFAGFGVILAAACAAATILLPPGRLRAAAMLAALALFPVLILGDQWDSRQIADLRDSAGRLVGLGALAAGVSAALAFLFRRWSALLPLAIVAALPFRVPLESGGDTANLLVPLYLVIAGGVLATVLRDWGARPAGPVAAGDPPPPAVAKASSGVVPPTAPPAGPGVWVPRLLAGFVALYAVQVLYSADFSKGLQDICFFFVPFSLVYGLLRYVSWDRKLLALVLWVIAVESTAFVIVGSVEYLSRELFWNDQVIRSNEFHTYFRVNSIFWDPNIYGRYLALVAVIAMSVLLWTRERRTFGLLTALIAVVWLGLVPTFSQSSFAALLGGLAVLAAMKWSLRWTLVAAGAGLVLAVSVVLFAGGVSKLSPDRCNVDTGGRCNLVTGGAKLFGQRPLWGYGSGSFPKAYREHIDTQDAPVSVSHTEPITIAAEGGLIGLALYAALLATALWTMAKNLRPSLLRLSASRAGGAVGGTTPEDASATAGGGGSPTATGPARQYAIARAAILATFTSLIVHTMAYAGFFEDPITWVLLALGVSLAAASQPRVVEPCRDTSAA
ncbi:MAG TPA: O-antigen ligase family protein [Solirubrobacterales bacterium]|nr:O-antigen ligase family protein [Solirubrobacterales bacterium]